MQLISPLPKFLVERHHVWRRELEPAMRMRLSQLAADGQSPAAMIVACCDSRVMASDVFGAEAGEFFVHRNIANLVPPYQPDGQLHGTSATIEFAVNVLKVSHLIVMGHYGCGGVASCLHQQADPSLKSEEKTTFVSQWLEVLEPRVPTVLAKGLNPTQTLRALEHEGVLLSLENLSTFPFVRSAVEAGKLQLHGIWNDIQGGVLEYYDPAAGDFRSL
jgi:carbonic anhydrase